MQIKLRNPRRSPQEHLAEQSIRLRVEAAAMPAGVARDRLIRMARQADTASRINAWVASRGLKAPN